MALKKGQEKPLTQIFFFHRFSFARSSGHVTPFSKSVQIYTFISTSTPLGNSNFIKASIVLEEEL